MKRINQMEPGVGEEEFERDTWDGSNAKCTT